MPKVRKVRRRKTYKVSINRKRLRNKLRKLPNITCPQIKEAWENKKSTKSNLLQMGLAYDPNKSFKIPNLKTQVNTKKMGSGEFIVSDNKKLTNRIPKKQHIALALEDDAKAPRESKFRLPEGRVQFITYFMDKYGDDYEAMVRDRKNYDQLTPRQFRSRINTFKKIPEQYAEYLVKKGEIILDDPEPLEETKKKIAEENLKKHCAPRKVKKPKRTLSQWVEETIEDERPDTFDTMDTLEDDDDQKKVQESQGVKKLDLFADDDDKKIKKSKLKNNNAKVDQSSDEEDLEDFDKDNTLKFHDLSDMSDEELSDDDIMDDDKFISDSE